jgi:drug/metabolite transporter (DMT)-like permease
MPFVGELSALLTAVCWSASAFLFAEATSRAGAMPVNILRLILACVMLACAVVVFRLHAALSSSQVINLSISGVIGLSLGDSFLFRAFREIGARLSMLVMSLAPAFGAVLAYLMLDERLSLTGMTGIGVTLAGIVIVVIERKERESTKYLLTGVGLLYAALGAVGQGAGLIFAKMAFLEGELNGFVAALIRIAASLVVMVPVLMAAGRFANPVPVFRGDRRAFWFTAGGAVFGPVLGISFSLISVANTKVGIAATIMATVPILMLPIARFVTKEHLSWQSVCGAFVTVAGVAILFLR